MIIGYNVYGEKLQTNETIFQTIERYHILFQFPSSIVVYIANSLVVMHLFAGKYREFFTKLRSHTYLYCSHVLVFRREIWRGSWNKPLESNSCAWGLVCYSCSSSEANRFAFLVFCALFLPYFSDLIALIGSLSFSLTVYILPWYSLALLYSRFSLFYWKLSPPLWEKFLLSACIFYAIFGKERCLFSHF